MTTDLQNAPQTEQSDTPQPACCPWRTALQVPLLLAAAAGLGFAGQQAWHNRTDFQSLWPHLTVCALGNPTCNASLAHMEYSSSAAHSASCATSTASSCASSANAVAEVEADESVSALSPENLSDEL